MKEKNMPYDAIDISRYIINYCNDNDIYISNLKLQKLLYFIQAYFLINKENPRACFGERIEAWDFGPVVPKVYYEFRRFNLSNIISQHTYLEYDEDNIWNVKRKKFDSSVISKEDKKLIEEVVDYFLEYSPPELCKIVLKQKPWKDAYENINDNEITPQALIEYFGRESQVTNVKCYKKNR
jgi:uncharacterized phage-associated protein